MISHLGVRGRWISECKASLVYREFQNSQGWSTEKPYLKKIYIYILTCICRDTVDFRDAQALQSPLQISATSVCSLDAEIFILMTITPVRGCLPGIIKAQIHKIAHLTFSSLMSKQPSSGTVFRPLFPHHIFSEAAQNTYALPAPSILAAKLHNHTSIHYNTPNSPKS